MTIWNTITVFFAGFAIDVAYVAWFRGIGDGQKLQAAFASMAIGACGLLGITGVVADRWLALPYLLGLGCGTVAGMLLKPAKIERLEFKSDLGNKVVLYREERL